MTREISRSVVYYYIDGERFLLDQWGMYFNGMRDGEFPSQIKMKELFGLLDKGGNKKQKTKCILGIIDDARSMGLPIPDGKVEFEICEGYDPKDPRGKL